MKTYIQPGHTLTLPAPAGGVVSGQGVLIGTLFGIAQVDAIEGAELEILTEGVVKVPKTSALQIDVGDRLFWDATNKVVNKTATAQVCVGVAVSAVTNSSDGVRINRSVLNPAGT